MYAFVARVFGQTVDLFYRRRMLGGSIPHEGPTLVVANHPNALIDPVLIMRAADRPMRFLAKSTIFGMPVVGRLAKWARALPVYRAQDGVDTSANQDMFAAVYRALAEGDAVCLFPEGVSHNEPSLQPLKTGAARMALGAQAAVDRPLGLKIVPVGLNYRDKAIFRSEVAVQVGEPIEVDAGWRARHAEDPRAAARALTEEIGDAIRTVTVNLDAWDDLPVLELAGRIWGDDRDSTELLAAMADAQRSFLVTHPARVEALRQRILAFGADLDQLGLSPEALDARIDPVLATRFVMRNLVAVILGLPAALLGAIAYFVPYQLIRVLTTVFKPEQDIVATAKVLAGVLFFVPWHIGLVVWAVLAWGPLAGVLVSIGLPLCAVYTHHFIERRIHALGRARVAVWLLGRRARSMSSRLRAERDAIRQEIDALAAEYG